ncbi:MAG: HlyC/CorC family transporter [Chromatiales bacterium]
MNDISLSTLFVALFCLLVLSACFSGSETAMMAANRYRLRHLAAKKNRGAIKASELLERPDRLIGLLLVGNNAVNNAAVTIATIIGLQLMGDGGAATATFILTIVMLIFSEVLPKTLAALRPERIALPAAHVLSPLLRVTYPIVVWPLNAVTSWILGLVGIHTDKASDMPLSREELRTVVKEAGAMIPRRHQQMLFAILDLEKGTVEDIMVPRNEIVGVDLNASLNGIIEQLTNCRHTRVPVYRDSIEQIVGLLHVRRLPRLLADDRNLTVEEIEAVLDEPYYVPVGTPLHTQLLNFQRHRERVGLVVDEYGDLQGLVTLEDLLEEIVGEFSTDPQNLTKDIYPQPDGSYLVDGTATIREINRAVKWKLPTDGPKTLNGLILETLESIPEPGTGLKIGPYTIEIVQATSQSVKTARLMAGSGSTAERASSAPPPAE